MKIKKGDKVWIRAGKDKGKIAVVERAIPSEGKVIVSGINLSKKHRKPSQANRVGGIADKAMPVPVSKVSIINSADKPARVAYRIEDGKKQRIDAKTKEVLS